MAAIVLAHIPALLCPDGFCDRYFVADKPLPSLLDDQADMADLRTFQTCIYYLQGKCTNGPACPYKHDEAEARTYQSALASNARGTLSVPERHCWFFLRGAAGCSKGSACHFIHEQGTKQEIIEQRVHQPLSNLSARHTSFRLPPPKLTPQAASPAPLLRLSHNITDSGDNGSLVIQLDEASPRSQHPKAQLSAPHRSLLQQPPPTNGSVLRHRVRPQLHSRSEVGQWGSGRENHTSQLSVSQPAAKVALERHQVAPLGATLRARDDGAIESLDDSRNSAIRNRTQVNTLPTTKRSLPAMRSSILARLGPRVLDNTDGHGPDEAEDDDDPQQNMEDIQTTESNVDRRPSLLSRISEAHRSRDCVANDRKRAVVAMVDNRKAEELQLINPRRIVKVADPPRSATAAKRARLLQPLEPLKRSPVAAAPHKATRRQVSSPEAPAIASQPLRLQTSADVGAVPPERQKRMGLHNALVGSQKVAANFKPPKSREQLRREREAAEGKQATTSGQQLARHDGSSPSMLNSRARSQRSDRAAEGAGAPAVITSASLTSAPTRLSAHQTVGRESVHASVVSPRAAPRAQPTAQSQQVSKSNSDEFEWNADAIDDDLEDLMEEDGEEGDLDLISDGLLPAATPSAAGTSNDFEKELAAFENAFD